MKKRLPGPIRILFAPLDWGLGHATRCIPLIRFFAEKGCTVWIAAEGRIEELLQQEFPDLSFIPLRGYRIRYAGTKTGLVFKIMRQIPGILQTIRYERQWLEQVLEQHHFDAVISDNRFGLSTPSVPCIYLTHQLSIQTPGGSLMEAWLRRLHYHYINRFQACWIPDAKTAPTLSGKLAHPKRLPHTPVTYLGPLSRFIPEPDAPLTYELLILLSGPEPQRTLFEEHLLRELKTFDKKTLFVRGLPGDKKPLAGFNQVEIINHLPASALNQAICHSHRVIARTGYTTVMDLVRLEKKSILVPTPGQTEQEYLGKYLRSEGLAYTTSQRGFSLSRALEEAGHFRYRFPEGLNGEAYLQVAEDFLTELLSR